ALLAAKRSPSLVASIGTRRTSRPEQRTRLVHRTGDHYSSRPHLTPRLISRRAFVREGEAMDRSHARFVSMKYVLTLLLAAATLISSTGCPAILATGIYLWDGGNLAPAECEALKGHRV